MNFSLLEIKRVESKGLQVTWSDKSVFLSSQILRSNCPSAISRAQRGDQSHDKPLTTPKKSALKVLSASLDEELDLKKIWSVGSYAIGIEWGDGHNTGIYTFDFLRELSSLSAQNSD
jgi:DUF971 family protein